MMATLPSPAASGDRKTNTTTNHSAQWRDKNTTTDMYARHHTGVHATEGDGKAESQGAKDAEWRNEVAKLDSEST